MHFFDISTSKSGPKLVCFILFCTFGLDMCFVPQQRASFHLSSGQLAPVNRDFPTFSRTLPLLSSHFFSALISSLLPFSSLTLPTSAFPSVHIVGSLTSKLPSIIYRCHLVGNHCNICEYSFSRGSKHQTIMKEVDTTHR